jgi:hypothetical protein
MLRVPKAALIAGIFLALDHIRWLVHSVGSWTGAAPGHRWHGFIYVPLNALRSSSMAMWSLTAMRPSRRSLV